MKRTLMLLGVVLGLTAAPVSAGEREELEALRATTVKLIEQLVEQGVLPRDKANEILREAQRAGAAAVGGGVAPATGAAGAAGAAAGAATGAAASGGTAAAAGAATAAAAGTVRVPYVPQAVRDEMKNEIRQEVLAQARSERWGEPSALPEWLGRFTFDGDLRLRYQGNFYADGNAPYISPQATNNSRSLQLLNTTSDQSLFRVRARFGFTARVTDDLQAGFRLATSIGTDPLSSNVTMGNYWNRYPVYIDRAFLQYDPTPWLRLAGGRFANPWLAGEIRSDMLWAEDLSFDGVYARVRPEVAPGTFPFVTAGAFPLQNSGQTAGNKWLFGVQGGVDWQPIDEPYRARLGVAYFDYVNTTGVANPPGSSQFDYTAPLFLQKGNTLFNISSDPTRPLLGLASDYRLINVTGEASTAAFGEQRAFLSGDYVHNLGFDESQVSARVGTNVAPETTGWNVQLGLGRPELRARNDWLLTFGYRYVQRDAAPDSFVSSDFWLGGTNTKGYTAAFNYGLDRNVWMRLRYLSGDQISGPPLGIDVLQVDVNARF